MCKLQDCWLYVSTSTPNHCSLRTAFVSSQIGSGWKYQPSRSDNGILRANYTVQWHKCCRGTRSSLAPGRCGRNFNIILFKLISWTDISCAACKIVERWIPQNSTDDESTLVQVMAWCHQATNHYLSQCWSRTMSPYGITMPQWAKKMTWWLYSVIQSWLIINSIFRNECQWALKSKLNSNIHSDALIESALVTMILHVI